MVSRAMKRAGSDSPLQVALALEGMRYDGPTGEVWIRPEDHQAMMPLFQTIFVPTGQPGVKHDSENTRLGWKTEGKLDMVASPPSIICRIRRP
jgi:branched-chain amino acid transport system substrate-binding protein